MHDDWYTQIPSDLSAVDHSFGGSCRRIEVVALDLSGLRLCLITSFCNEEEPIAPSHERLAIDILIVLGEVKSTT